VTRLFLDEHAWSTLEAAMARIIPTDEDAGAREAGTIVFLDRYLAGSRYVYADPAGDGFLRLDAKRSDAWARRIEVLRERYRVGVAQLDQRARELHGSDYVGLSEADQDRVLAAIEVEELGPPHAREAMMQRPVSDREQGFFGTLVLHTRQGFFADPAYGGNRGRAGWNLVAFPAPGSLADAQAGIWPTSEEVQWSDPTSTRER
jgi:gluconate 2-dehydrogenase gamma chain